MPKSNLNIYAKYEYFTLTLINEDENAGTIPDYNNTKVIADSVVILKASTKDGYAFLGWADENGDYVTDVIGGFIFGLIYLILFIKYVYKNDKMK